MEEEEIIIKGFTDCVYFLASPLTCKKVLYINHLFVRVLYNLNLQILLDLLRLFINVICVMQLFLVTSYCYVATVCVEHDFCNVAIIVVMNVNAIMFVCFLDLSFQLICAMQQLSFVRFFYVSQLLLRVIILSSFCECVI